jgi:hypothetical protein
MSTSEFDGQRPGEKVLFVFRRHFLTTRKGLFGLALCLGLGIAAMIIWPMNMMSFVAFLVLMVIGAVLNWYVWMLWYFSV